MENMRLCVHCTLSSQCYGKLHSMFKYSCRKPKELAFVKDTKQTVCLTAQGKFCDLCMDLASISQLIQTSSKAFPFGEAAFNCTSLADFVPKWQHHAPDIIYFQANVVSLIIILMVDYTVGKVSSCYHAQQENITVI